MKQWLNFIKDVLNPPEIGDRPRPIDLESELYRKHQAELENALRTRQELEKRVQVEKDQEFNQQLDRLEQELGFYHPDQEKPWWKLW